MNNSGFPHKPFMIYPPDEFICVQYSEIEFPILSELGVKTAGRATGIGMSVRTLDYQILFLGL